MAATNLEQKIQEIGNPVDVLRNASLHFSFPMKPEYTNFRDEQEAWKNTAILFDQNHMMETYFKGPDVKRLFSETAINKFDTFGRNKAKQFVAVNSNGKYVGDSILFGLEDDQYALVGTPSASHWAAFRASTGDYDVEVTFDPPKSMNPNPRLRFRFQLQGPAALKIIENAIGAPMPKIKFFNIGEFEIAGVPVRALNHTMVGIPGLENTGLEMTGPTDKAEVVWDALVRAGEEFGLLQGGSRCYPTTSLETGWIAFAVGAIYTGDDMKSYREWLPADGYEANLALAGSFASEDIEDYYFTPWDFGYGRLVDFNHEFIGRDALLKSQNDPHQKKVWLRWNDEDVAKTIASSLFGGKDRAKFIDVPVADYGISQYDKVLDQSGSLIGTSHYSAYTVNIGGYASIATLDEDRAVDGTEVTLIWGEEGGGSAKPAVERHVQTEIRATIHTTALC
jgi:glycine cleavage system aminomethyltransferase T